MTSIDHSTENDLNATIAAAVNARISAQVAAALSGDEVIGKYVAATLQQKITVRGKNYRDVEISFIDKLVGDSIREATEAVVKEVIASEVDAIREATRKAVKAKVGSLADAFADALLEEATTKNYSAIKVAIEYPSR